MKNNKDFLKLTIVFVIVIAIWGAAWYLIAQNITDWEKRGTFGDMFGAVNSIFSALALVCVVYSINIQIKATKSDHDRRRKQATIEYLNLIRPIYKSLLADSEKTLGPDIITSAGLETILKNNELRNTVKDFLSTLEHLCVGANTAVFDKELLFRMSANYLTRMYYKFKPYIDYVQQTLPTAYIEYEGLVKEFEDKRKLRPSLIGNLGV